MSLFGCFGAPKPARMGTGVTNSRANFLPLFLLEPTQNIWAFLHKW